MKRTSWFIFFLFLAVSCLDDPDCYQLNNNMIGITFRVMGSSKVDTVALWGVDIQGSDSIFMDTVLATGIPLPLNYTRDQTDLLFRLVGASYSMKLGYDSRTQFVSEDCGSRYVLSDLKILEYDFDSTRVVNSVPGKTASTNIEVFRCPVTDIVTMSFRELYLSGGKGTSRFGGVALEGITPNFTADVFYPESRTTTVYLPVNLAADQTSFVFYYQNGESKTLTLNYRRTVEERFAPCGIQTFVDSLVIADSYTFDSASLVVADKKTRSTLLDPHDANIYLYRCPETNLTRINFRTRTGTSGTSSRADTVFLKSVTADYTPTIFYSNIFTTSITLPVNPDAASTIFTLEYADRTEVVSLDYTRYSPVALFERCEPKPLFSDLTETIDIENVTILRTDSLQYPPVSNIEIYHN